MSVEKPVNLPPVLSKISGRIYSEEGATLKGANVAYDEMETKTLADGFFVLDDLSPGTYEVRASLQGFRSASKSISIQEGEEVTLDFSLSKARGTAKVHGHVYDDESGKTVEQDGTVILILPVANEYKHIGRDGYYEFENLPAGKYKILTSIPGYEDRHVTLTLTDDETRTQDFCCQAKKIEEPPWG